MQLGWFAAAARRHASEVCRALRIERQIARKASLYDYAYGVFVVGVSYLLAVYHVGRAVDNRELAAWTFGILNAGVLVILFARYRGLLRDIRDKTDKKARP